MGVTPFSATPTTSTSRPARTTATDRPLPRGRLATCVRPVPVGRVLLFFACFMIHAIP